MRSYGLLCQLKKIKGIEGIEVGVLLWSRFMGSPVGKERRKGKERSKKAMIVKIGQNMSPGDIKGGENM